MLGSNWLKNLKSLWNIVIGEIFGSLGMIFKEKLALKNCKNFLVAKALVNAYILCEIRVELCLTRAAQKVFSALGSNFVGQLIVSCPFNI